MPVAKTPSSITKSGKQKKDGQMAGYINELMEKKTGVGDVLDRQSNVLVSSTKDAPQGNQVPSSTSNPQAPAGSSPDTSMEIDAPQGNQVPSSTSSPQAPAGSSPDNPVEIDAPQGNQVPSSTSSPATQAPAGSSPPSDTPMEIDDAQRNQVASSETASSPVDASQAPAGSSDRQRAGELTYPWDTSEWYTSTSGDDVRIVALWMRGREVCVETYNSGTEKWRRNLVSRFEAGDDQVEAYKNIPGGPKELTRHKYEINHGLEFTKIFWITDPKKPKIYCCALYNSKMVGVPLSKVMEHNGREGTLRLVAEVCRRDGLDIPDRLKPPGKNSATSSRQGTRQGTPPWRSTSSRQTSRASTEDVDNIFTDEESVSTAPNSVRASEMDDKIRDMEVDIQDLKKMIQEMAELLKNLTVKS